MQKAYKAVITETTGIVIVLSWNTVFALFFYLILHTAATLILSSALETLISKEKNKKAFWAFFSLILFTGPTGVFGSFLIYTGLLKKRFQILHLLETVNLENLPEINFQGRKIGEGQMKAGNVNNVFYMSRFIHPAFLKFLKNVIEQNRDEARILAFSTITNLEKSLMEKIAFQKRRLKNAKENEKFEILCTIGELYWEMVYLNLSDKELSTIYLTEALKYLKEALNIRETGKLYFLLGRIYLKLGVIDYAEECFYKALHKGFDKKRALVYLIEALYLKKDFAEIFNLLKKYQDTSSLDYKTELIMNMWR